REFVSGVFAYVLFHQYPFIGFNAGQIDTSESEGWAGFGDASYMITERVELGAGTRYYSDQRGAFDHTPLEKLPVGTKDKLTYRGYLRFAATSQINLYATVGTGFRSGDFNLPFTIGFGAPRTFGPETSKSYEIGAKTTFLNNRGGFDIALYREN